MMNLICLIGKINIEYVNCGRIDGNVCFKIIISKIDCWEKKFEEIVKSKCDEKINCSINVLNIVFKDFSEGILKYLEVKYICV